ncbi:MAG: tetratricopeptide repeat protein, partial [Pseudomonadota bacterium]
EARLAEDNFLHAIKLAPTNADLYSNYGWFLCQTGREAQSIAQFDIALSNRSYQAPAKALNNAGLCSLKLKNNVAAERYFSQAFQLDPANPSTNSNLARIYYERRDFERAKFYIGRATKTDILPPDVLWLAIRIERHSGDPAVETSLVTQLRRRHPDSPEYAAYKRGAFNE